MVNKLFDGPQGPLPHFRDPVITLHPVAVEPEPHPPNPISLYFFMARDPLFGKGLIIEALRLHSNTPQLVGLLWTSDQPVVQTSTLQHSTLTTDIRTCPRRDSYPQLQKSSGRVPTTENARQLGPAHFYNTLITIFSHILTLQESTFS